MTSLWFVQPVHGRVGLTRLCMEQRRRMVDELAGLGVDAQMVVVGNDVNLDTARELDFHALERPNILGMKVNDGFEYACKRGADFVSYIGSDDWALASWFATMPPVDRVKTSRWVAFVAPAGDRLIVREVPGSVGNAPWIIPRELLALADFRPVRANRMNGIDGSIRDGLTAAARAADARSAHHQTAALRRQAARDRIAVTFQHEDGDELRFVDFKGSREQITSYSLALSKPRRLRYDEPNPWPTLATRYPADLVERMEKFYAEGMPQ
jgi:hypothetical protein